MIPQPPPAYAFTPPPPPARWWRRRRVGAPLALIIVGALLAGLFALLALGLNPVYFSLGMLPSVLAFGLGVWGCLWLDRWEPEPLPLVVLALTWGGGISIVAALLLEILLSGGSDFVDAAIIAPVAEEAMKGAFVLFMVTGVRRREMNSITDHITYAALVGFGFAFIENLVYFASADSPVSLAVMAIVRTGFDMFGHPLATVVFSIGVWYARQRRNPLLGVAGFIGAAVLHGSWNAAAVADSLPALIGVYVLLMLPTLVAVIRLATRGRRQEAQLLAHYLPEMVLNGLISPFEASWIGDLRARSAARQQVSGSSEGRAHVAYLLDAVVALAHVRQQFDAGRGTNALLAEQVELVNGIHLERAAAFGYAVTAPPAAPPPAPTPAAPTPWPPPAQPPAHLAQTWAPPAQTWAPPAQPPVIGQTGSDGPVDFWRRG